MRVINIQKSEANSYKGDLIIDIK